MSKRQKLALESRLMGPAHAADHAAQRAVLRDPRERARLARAERRIRARTRRARASAANDPAAATNGQWADPITLPAVAVHAALLSTGKVLTFQSGNRVSLWDPTTSASKLIDPPRINGQNVNIFCAGQSFLADGRLLVTGGQIGQPVGDEAYRGSKTVFLFDPVTETWARQPDMREGRWYPTQVLLADGRTAIMDGLDSSGVNGAPSNNDIEIFTVAPERDKPGTITQLGRRGGAGQPPDGGLYPHLFTMPSGRTLVAGPADKDSWFLNALGSGFNFSWNDTGNPQNHYFGTGVILPKDTPGSSEVALFGGDGSKAAEFFDETKPGDGWTRDPAKDLNQVRGHHNTVLLPDGSMVTVGGGYGNKDGRKDLFAPGNLDAELYNPATRTWRRGAAQLEGRAYHSTALLLPDGRVMSAGDDTNGGNSSDTAEIFSPPYLFNADGSASTRPTIADAPEAVGYGQSFPVSFSTTDLAKAVLIAPGAVTHANDMSQRYVPLTVSGGTSNSAMLTAPANANNAPPGRYMLFLINSKGVPSKARFVQVGGTVSSGGGTTPSGGGSTTPTPTGGGSTPTTTGGGTTPTTTGGGTTPTTTGGVSPQPGAQSPLLKLSPVKRQTLSTVRRRGLRVVAGCSQTCKVTAHLRLDRTTAVSLRLAAGRSSSSSVLIGSDSVRLRRGQNGQLTVVLTSAAKRRLSRTRTVNVRLTLTAVDSAGHKQTSTRRLTLKR